MERFAEPALPVWDLSQSSSFSQLPDDDFLALLQKQFSTNGLDLQSGGFTDGINPRNLDRQPLPTFTPPSEDSSPSPPQITNNSNPRRNSDHLDDHSDSEDHDSALKRKATSEDPDDGPSQKSQHTMNPNKKGGSRRKSTGNGGPEDNRLLKRKEQNRAAQRAFRERKEKHVKDLEDKVAELEEKNEKTQSENENLRDLLARLQTENVALKQTAFTFSVPTNAASQSGSFDMSSETSHTQDPPMNLFETSTSNALTPASSSSLQTPPPISSGDSIDWDSLTSFDPSVLRLLDDSSPGMANNNIMDLDFGFNQEGMSANAPYTTIASNPLFMSFADQFDSTPLNNDANAFNFNMASLTPWSTSSAGSKDSGSFDELFGGSYNGPSGPVDFSALLNSPPSSVSPVSHASQSPPIMRSMPSQGSGLSSLSTSSETPASDAPRKPDDHSNCPKTRAEAAERISQEAGPSPFVSEPTPMLRKDPTNRSIGCKGALFPKTALSDENVEVLAAWRSITSNPLYKDTDINELCSEFTKKARCDGTKVVLEPQGVNQILEKLSKR